MARQWDVFLSYARQDVDRAHDLARRLELEGLRVFFDLDHISPGENWRDSLHAALDSSEVFVAVCSRASTTSHWLAHEASIAVDNAVRGRGSVVPVYLDAHAITSVPEGLGRFQGVEAFDRQSVDAAVATIVRAARRSNIVGLSHQWSPPDPDHELIPSNDLSGVVAAIQALPESSTGWLQVFGPGGVGKTTAAAEGARVVRDEFDEVVWIRAAEIDRAAADLRSELDLPPGDSFDAVFSLLRRRRGLLIVLDDVHEVTTLAKIRTSLSTGDALVTTSRARLDGESALVEMVGLAATDLDRFVDARSEARDRTSQSLGVDHPSALSALADLASANALVGRYTEAIRGLEELAERTERVLGSSHPTSLDARADLAVAYAAVGRSAEADHLLSELSRDLHRILGPEDPKTVTVEANLAALRRQRRGDSR